MTCRGQAVIALSSGEAEYYGLVSAACEGLGYVSLAKDFGILLKLHIWLDASTAISIGSRRGLVKLKHVDTIFLWVQDLYQQGRMTLGKKHTTENFADIITKAVDAQTIRKFILGMGFEYLSGESRLALKV